MKGASPVYLSREVIAKQRKEKQMQIDCKSKRRYGYPEPESAFSGSNIQIQLFYQVNVYIDGKFSNLCWPKLNAVFFQHLYLMINYNKSKSDPY